jgi:hypothetical protein
MKLSLTIHDKTFSVESEEEFDGTNLNELAEQLKGLLVGAGFHPSNVDDMFNTEYQWFTEEERDENMQGHLKSNKYNEGYAKGWDEAKHEDKVKAFQDDLYKKDDDDMFS